MKASEALALIRSSAPYNAAGGDVAAGWVLWDRANPREADRLNQHVSGDAPPPELATKWGKGWVALLSQGYVPPPVLQDAELIVAPGGFSAFPPTTRGVLAFNEGFRRISSTVYPPGDASVPANLRNWKSQRDALRAAGLRVGGFAVATGTDTRAIVDALAVLDDAHGFDYLLVDVEWYKADSNGRAAADALPGLVTALNFVWQDKVALIGFGDTGGALCGATSATDPKPIVRLNEIPARVPYVGEAYKNDGTAGSIDNTLTQLRQCLPVKQLRVAVGRYDVAAQAQALVDAHLKFGVVGFSVWDAGNLDDAGVREFGKAIRAGAARV